MLIFGPGCSVFGACTPELLRKTCRPLLNPVNLSFCRFRVQGLGLIGVILGLYNIGIMKNKNGNYYSFEPCKSLVLSLREGRWHASGRNPLPFRV